MPTLYTFGYQSARIDRVLYGLNYMNIPLVDIRMSRYAGFTRDQWSDPFVEKVAPVYYWVQALGNSSYQESRQSQTPVLTYVNLEVGLARFDTILDDHGKAAICCACAGVNRCHRKDVAAHAQKRLSCLRVFHL